MTESFEKALSYSSQWLDIISQENVDEKQAKWIITESKQNFANHFNKGWLEYRKSVTEAGDWAAVEWTGTGSSTSNHSRAHSARTEGAKGRKDSRRLIFSFRISFMSARRGSHTIERLPSARGPHSMRPWNQPTTAPPAIAAAAIFAFTIAWGAYIYPLAFIYSGDQMVLTTALVTLAERLLIPWHISQRRS